ncbi:MAG: hypothetical protein IK080_03195 [Clostridia bacterium]|nr:hypothetical protein [Clostridia bacterium]
MKKKMTLSFAFACILCVTVLAAVAFAVSGILGDKPDETLQPLSPGVTETPAIDPAPETDAMNAVYWHREDGHFYHADETCSGMKNAVPVSAADAQAMGQEPCPICVGQAVQAEPSYDGAMSAALEDTGLVSGHNTYLCTGEPRAWGIELLDPNCENFYVSSEPLNSSTNGQWSNDILTVHSAVVLRTRGALYCEFEFSMNVQSISPWSIRITPDIAGMGLMGWRDAKVLEVTNADNETHYLLSITMESPNEPSVSRWCVYGGPSEEQRHLIAEFGVV